MSLACNKCTVSVKFFQNTTAAELLLEDQSFKYVMTHILKLIQTDPSSEPNTGLRTVVDQSPLVECCVKSYIAMGGVCYQIFDTCLTRSNTDN
ncbi:hypothetical protein LSH36_2643g00001 [Paralvinella palmiformis]|uniref:Uncharacterized protein n=1 Tax=Paralvinella palmiformis TaxID=53620 RepID=A0AAD9MKA9_9ANNE|nr:hypothetical protein LSH36_2643g00001 [Paralvinella palmiformis]